MKKKKTTQDYADEIMKMPEVISLIMITEKVTGDELLIKKATNRQMALATKLLDYKLLTEGLTIYETKRTKNRRK